MSFSVIIFYCFSLLFLVYSLYWSCASVLHYWPPKVVFSLTTAGRSLCCMDFLFQVYLNIVCVKTDNGRVFCNMQRRFPSPLPQKNRQLPASMAHPCDSSFNLILCFLTGIEVRGGLETVEFRFFSWQCALTTQGSLASGFFWVLWPRVAGCFGGNPLLGPTVLSSPSIRVQTEIFGYLLVLLKMKNVSIFFINLFAFADFLGNKGGNAGFAYSEMWTCVKL